GCPRISSFALCIASLPPPRLTLFPYTTLFRSGVHRRDGALIDEFRRLHPGILEHLALGGGVQQVGVDGEGRLALLVLRHRDLVIDRKSTRLNSSHVKISYAVVCLEKKNHLK